MRKEKDEKIYMRDKRIYDYRTFDGTDVSIRISLFEYGLIWKKFKGSYKFVYGVKAGKGGVYTHFEEEWLDADINVKEEFNWINWDSLFDYVGMSEEEFMRQGLPRQISDLISHYGYEEILGDSEGFEISGYE